VGSNLGDCARPDEFSYAKLCEDATFARVAVPEHAVRGQLVAVAVPTECTTHTTPKLSSKSEYVVGKEWTMGAWTDIDACGDVAAAVWSGELDATHHRAPIIPRGSIVSVLSIWEVHDGPQAWTSDGYVWVGVRRRSFRQC
jgi:hypothetical protein